MLSGLPDLLTSESAVAALMQMKKIDIAALERARDREPSLH